jgi:uncharacterized protein YdeI (YjbR/CyaY-like superfamily)
MKDFSTEIDAYIDRAGEFSRPILKKVRKLYHQACPLIEETIRWGVPTFAYKGLVGRMAAFKNHVSLGFWKARLLTDPQKLLASHGTTMSAIKLTRLADLPPDKVLVAYIREAVTLNEQGIKAPAPKRAPKPPPTVPDYILDALNKNKRALATFEAFSPSHKREYVEWITEAKQEATRAQRLAQAIEWMAEGKPRNWKYMKR